MKRFIKKIFLISYQSVIRLQSKKNLRMNTLLEMKTTPISRVFEIENKLKDKESLLEAIEEYNKTGKHQEIDNILNDQRVTLSKIKSGVSNVSNSTC